jgi:putative membrane protein
MQHKHMLLCLSLAMGVAGCTTMKDQIQSSGSMGSVDTDYINTAMQLIQLDTLEGKLAATKGSDSRIADVAASLTGQANAFSPTFVAVLQAQGVTPPSAPSPETAAKVARLQALSGPAFDRQFVADELAAHKMAVDAFQKEDASTKDGAMRNQVETQLPAVQDNFNKLQNLSSEYNPTAHS